MLTFSTFDRLVWMVLTSRLLDTASYCWLLVCLITDPTRIMLLPIKRGYPPAS